MMRLFYTPATSSLFPHIVLNEAGLTFEKTKVDEHTKLMETGEDYRTINPLGFVPALRLDDGTVLTEGAVIVQHIAEVQAGGRAWSCRGKPTHLRGCASRGCVAIV